jgi:hypothetical protein
MAASSLSDSRLSRRANRTGLAGPQRAAAGTFASRQVSSPSQDDRMVRCANEVHEFMIGATGQARGVRHGEQRFLLLLRQVGAERQRAPGRLSELLGPLRVVPLLRTGCYQSDQIDSNNQRTQLQPEASCRLEGEMLDD